MLTASIAFASTPGAWPALAAIAPTSTSLTGVAPLFVFGVPFDFILFGLTVIGIALVHHSTLEVALTGLAAIVACKLIFTGFKFGTGLSGFGGSMIWFGSSAGVALSNRDPEANSVGRWLHHGWHVALSYVVGFLTMLLIRGCQPDAPHKKRVELPVASGAIATMENPP